jgi:signal transduction histidine kinase
MVHETPAIERIAAQTYRRQQIAFCLLTVSATAALLMLHVTFAKLLGEPSSSVMLVLAVTCLAKIGECLWLARQSEGINIRTARIETAVSILVLFVLVWILTVLTDRDDAPYFVLLAIAILQCAYHFGLVETVATIAASIGMMFAWQHHFFTLHPPQRTTEFLESGMVSVTYSVMGVLVWYLVKQLGKKESSLNHAMNELEAAREKLAREERLAAVGRLASGIAHEIRNPVAMIASSLETAVYPGMHPSDQEEMFTIAAREAKRLEKLTADFLAYAKPSSPQKTPVRICEILDHVAALTRIRAADKRIEVKYQMCADESIEIDPFQVEGALVNLSMNSIDAAPLDGAISMTATFAGSSLLVEIENTGESIPESDLDRIFEPFFTTKHNGTGLGLAIARGVTRAHGGDLWVSKNAPGSVAFTMSLAAARDTDVRERSHG